MRGGALLLAALLFVSCAQPSGPANNAPAETVKTPEQGNAGHKGKGDHKIQSVNVIIDNGTSESFDVTVNMLVGSDVVSVPSGPGISYDDVPSSAVSMSVNGQTVPYNTPTDVTLPNSNVVKITWQQGSSITVNVVLSGG